jgi:hypothetical protein
MPSVIWISFFESFIDFLHINRAGRDGKFVIIIVTLRKLISRKMKPIEMSALVLKAR